MKKDFVFFAIVTGLFVFILPVSSLSANENLMGGNMYEQYQKELTELNSVLESGVRLFDIKFELESALLEKSSDLVSRIRFESFGKVLTLVNLEYKITDFEGKERYSEKNEVMVETEKLVAKEFDGLNLEKGKYVLILTTLYNKDVKDEFKQSFEVNGLPVSKGWPVIAIWTTLILFITGVIGYIVYRFIEHKKQAIK